MAAARVNKIYINNIKIGLPTGFEQDEERILYTTVNAYVLGHCFLYRPYLVSD